MLLTLRPAAFLSCLLCLFVLTAALARAQEAKPADHTIGLAEGKLTLEAPKNWVRKQPRTRIVEHEFAAPSGKEDVAEGRFTVMAAGGGIDANIERWASQFSPDEATPAKERVKVQKLKIAGQEVHYVDIAGTFKDQAGPFAPATSRPNYRLLGAIIVTEKLGLHFLKLTGPKETVAAQEKAFQDMLNTLKLN
jgi:hypothetical protein